jgi:hypothetical protein
VKPIPSQLKSVSPFETGTTASACAPQGKGQNNICERPHIFESVKGLFALCRKPNTRMSRSDRFLDIVLSRHPGGRIAVKASVRTIQGADSWHHHGDYRTADGFQVYEDVLCPDGVIEATTRHLLSPDYDNGTQDIHMGNSHIFNEDSPPQPALSEPVSLTRSTVQRLLEAASDPKLNPEIAQNISENQILRAEAAGHVEPLAA